MKKAPLRFFAGSTRLVAGLLLACVCLGGCASFKAALQNMTPAQRVRYEINIAYTVATEALNIARLFMDNEEDLDKVQSKLHQVTEQVKSSVNIILALIPPDMEGVQDYAQEKITELEETVEALEATYAPEALEPLEE